MEEYLRFNAQLRLARSTPAAQVSRAVHRLLADFALHSCASSRIGDAFLRGISGGEHRRLSIAAELLTRPPLLLVDEPTTGLDATSAKRVVAILAHLAGAGVAVVLSIHQPRADIFAMMSHVLLLASHRTLGGRTVYSGAAAAAEAHFAALGRPKPAGVNVADFVLDVVVRASPDEAEALVAAFARSGTSYAQARSSASAQYAAALGAGVAGGGARAYIEKHQPTLRLQVRAPAAAAFCVPSARRRADVSAPCCSSRSSPSASCATSCVTPGSSSRPSPPRSPRRC